MHLNEQGWIATYQERQALWIYDSTRHTHHAELTSGKHSDMFFNSRLIIADDGLLAQATSDLLDLFTQQGGDLSNVEGVVGPQTGAKRMSELMAPQIGYGTWHASPAKRGTSEQKEMVFTDQEIVRIQGKTLVCEDVVTTAGSVELTARAITRAGGEVLPWILCLVNRSGQSEINGRKIVALITRYANIWDPTTCPACAEGSIVVRQPKDNWPQLNAVKGVV